MLDLSATYEVIIFSVGDTKAGTKMGKLQLKKIDDSSTLNCILWEETLSRLESKLFRTGNQVKILGATFNEKFNNCLISSMELIKEASLGLSEQTRDELFTKIIGYVNEFKNSETKEFTSSVLFEYEKLFKIMPAAKLMHHNYVGGLLQHTYECLQIAENIIKTVHQSLDTDIVYSACILHDFGKIFEYKIDTETGLIDYDDKFRQEWISHSQWGFSLCMQHNQKEIARMIAAHHGRTEWGSMIDLNQKDLDPIVYLVHHIDDLSAKYGKTSVGDLS